MKQLKSIATETSLKGKEVIDFRGKIIYVGIDVHQKDYQVAKFCNGVCLGNHRMEASSEQLIRHLHQHYPGATFECVYESCAWGFHLQRQLTAAGIDCIVVHAADVATNDKEKRRKTDKVDALKLARSLYSGELKGIYIPTESLQKDRQLIRYRFRLAGDLRRSKNRLKGLLKCQGISIPVAFQGNNWSRNFINWLQELALSDEALKDVLQLQIAQLLSLKDLLLQTERTLRKWRQGKYREQAALVSSVPGMGPTSTMLFLLEAGPVSRFKNFDALNDYVGLCPDSHSSGDTDRHTGITGRSHKQLRAIFVEAAWIAIRVDPALLEMYQQLCQRMKRTQAIVRIARKLLRKTRAVLLSGQPYQKGLIAITDGSR